MWYKETVMASSGELLRLFGILNNEFCLTKAPDLVTIGFQLITLPEE